ncbi:MAG: hypothetical protein JSR45_17230 [Proteobacteria bacterium]|nr:hypothetical protein [Pseudomonadota bacterium]
MIAPDDLGLIGLKVARRARGARRNPFVAAYAGAHREPFMAYALVCDGGDWRLSFHGSRAGRFASFEEALACARRLAHECAALGRPAAVTYADEAGRPTCERFEPRGVAFAGFLAPHQA